MEDLMEIVEIQKSRRTVSDIETNKTNPTQAVNSINYTNQTYMCVWATKQDPQIPSDIYLFGITYLRMNYTWLNAKTNTIISKTPCSAIKQKYKIKLKNISLNLLHFSIIDFLRVFVAKKLIYSLLITVFICFIFIGLADNFIGI